MPRRSLEENIKTGFLTPRNIAELIGISAPKIRAIMEAGDMKFLPVPGSSEKRVAAPVVAEYAQERNIPYDRRLDEAVKFYDQKFGETTETTEASSTGSN